MDNFDNRSFVDSEDDIDPYSRSLKLRRKSGKEAMAFDDLCWTDEELPKIPRKRAFLANKQAKEKGAKKAKTITKAKSPATASSRSHPAAPLNMASTSSTSNEVVEFNRKEKAQTMGTPHSVNSEGVKSSPGSAHKMLRTNAALEKAKKFAPTKIGSPKGKASHALKAIADHNPWPSTTKKLPARRRIIYTDRFGFPIANNEIQKTNPITPLQRHMSTQKTIVKKIVPQKTTASMSVSRDPGLQCEVEGRRLPSLPEDTIARATAENSDDNRIPPFQVAHSSPLVSDSRSVFISTEKDRNNLLVQPNAKRETNVDFGTHSETRECDASPEKSKTMAATAETKNSGCLSPLPHKNLFPGSIAPAVRLGSPPGANLDSAPTSNTDDWDGAISPNTAPVVQEEDVDVGDYVGDTLDMGMCWTPLRDVITPIGTSIVVSFIGYSIENAVIQRLFSAAAFDLRYLLNYTLFGGFFHGFIGHFFYHWLDTVLSRGILAVATKTLIEQYMWRPVLSLFFLSYRTWIKGGIVGDLTVKEIIAACDWKCMWLLPIYACNFAYLSTSYRLLFVHTVEIGVLLLLSLVH